MTCGERRTRDGVRRFVLIGVDLVAAAPTDPQHVNVGGGELIVVDVTDPTDPTITARAEGLTSTHTVACVDGVQCRYAYSAGGRGSFSVFDLRDLDAPKEVDGDRRTDGLQSFASPTGGHKWNFDAAGVGTHTGYEGASMWSTKKPGRPRLLATTGPKSGKLKYKTPGGAWRKVKLCGKTTKRGQVVIVRNEQSAPFTGKIAFRVMSRGKPVQLDAIMLR